MPATVTGNAVTALTLKAALKLDPPALPGLDFRPVLIKDRYVSNFLNVLILYVLKHLPEKGSRDFPSEVHGPCTPA